MTAPASSPWQTSLGPLATGDPLVLGILNITPDSMSDGGLYLDPAAALAQVRRLLRQGVRALDVGAESTRPQAEPVAPETEWSRLEPVLALLRSECPELPVSLDTRHASVAARGLQAGVAAINDVTGFSDPGLLHVARNSGCGLIAMRSRLEDGAFSMPPYGRPETASAAALILELQAVRDRLLEAGISRQRILLDPGIGFGTTFAEDLALWEALPGLPAALDWPVQGFCLGVSRKRFLAWRAGNPALPPADRDALSARAHREAIALGYRVLRSHTGPLPSIRLAGAEDAEALGRIQLASWRAAYRGIIPETVLEQLALEPQADAFRRMATHPQSPDFRLWLLEWQGRPVGYAATGPAGDPGEPEPAAEIHAFYLVKEAWGLGLGKALMGRALASFRELGYQAATLWVLERNSRARKFYETLGWHPSGMARTIWQDGIALREAQYQLSLETPAED